MPVQWSSNRVGSHVTQLQARQLDSQSLIVLQQIGVVVPAASTAIRAVVLAQLRLPPRLRHSQLALSMVGEMHHDCWAHGQAVLLKLLWQVDPNLHLQQACMSAAIPPAWSARTCCWTAAGRAKCQHTSSSPVSGRGRSEPLNKIPLMLHLG